MLYKDIKIGEDYAFNHPSPTSEDPRATVLRTLRITRKTQAQWGRAGGSSSRTVDGVIVETIQEGTRTKWDDPLGDEIKGMDADLLLGSAKDYHELVAAREREKARHAALQTAQHSARQEAGAKLEALGISIVRTSGGEVGGWGSTIDVGIEGYPERFEDLPEETRRRLA